MPCGASIRALSDGGAREATIILAELRVKHRDRAWSADARQRRWPRMRRYRFDRMKSKKDPRKGLAQVDDRSAMQVATVPTPRQRHAAPRSAQA